jgi:ATP-dependent RNA helicase DDX10/DBP4
MFSCLFVHLTCSSRGLDFPAVDWVVQLDCPEDADTYIHRVGRTARYEASGQALLMLLPSEEKGMLEALSHKRVPIERIHVNPTRVGAVSAELRALCSRIPEIKYLGQKVYRLTRIPQNGRHELHLLIARAQIGFYIVHAICVFAAQQGDF